MSRRQRIMSDRLKYEIAEELGFAHKVNDDDWGNITTREAGQLVREAIRRAQQDMVDNNTLPPSLPTRPL